MEFGKEVTLSVSFERELFSNDRYYMALVLPLAISPDKFPAGFKADGNGFVCKGYFSGPAYAHQTLDVTGEWAIKRKKTKDGREETEVFFHVRYAVPILPKSKNAVIAFLRSLKGIGKTLSEKLYAYCNGNLEEIYADDVDAMAATVPGLTRTKAATVWGEIQTLMAILEVTRILKDTVHGNTIKAITAAYTSNSLEMIKTRPYQMALDKIVSFSDSDRIAKLFGWSEKDKVRLTTGIICALRACKARNASVIVNKNVLLFTAHGMLGNSVEELNAILTVMRKDREIVSAGEYWYLQEDYETEKSLAERILELSSIEIPAPVQNRYLEQFKTWQKKNPDIKLAERQEDAVKAVADSVISVLTGGPGTGKTSTLKAIMSAYQSAFPESRITLMAPTGLASKRMSEACGREAGTIHKMLGLIPSSCEAGFDDSNGLSVDGGLIIIDEFSMVGIHLAKFLMDAIIAKPDVRIVIVGDVDQLPPVSAGSVLRSVIECQQVKTTFLNRNFRQEAGSAIVDAAVAINAGDKNLPYNVGNFKFERIENADMDVETHAILERVKIRFAESCKEYGVDGTYVLCPMRKSEEKDGKITTKTLLSTSSLNPILRDIANPPEAGKSFCKSGSKTFRVGDRIINLKNTEEVMNGEIGHIVKIESEGTPVITVQFPDDVKVEYTSDRFKEIELAYAITVHKSQGCEYASVIYPSSMTQNIMLKRNLLYTAVTRAKKNVQIIGSLDSVNTAVERVDEGERKDLLGVRIAFYKQKQK